MKLNVLVVDDSAVMRKIIIRTLRLSGVALGEVYEAANGKEGLRLVSEKWIDLALVDINMPIMSGEEMIDCVRQNQETKDIPILIISTESNEARIEKVKKNVNGFVHKPFTPESLREKIQDITGVSYDRENDGDPLSGSGYDF